MKKTLTYFEQILSITADNASNNDTMFDQLELLLDNFPGPANQTRCFLHILRIMAKSIIKQFDVPKTKNGPSDMVTDAVALALAKIAEGLDNEEWEEYENQEQNDDEADDQPLDAWMEVQDGLTEQEREDINLHVWPVRLMLTKVRKLQDIQPPISLIGH